MAERHALLLHHPVDRPAPQTAAEAVPQVLRRRDGQRRLIVVMERAAAEAVLAGLRQGDAGALGYSRGRRVRLGCRRGGGRRAVPFTSIGAASGAAADASGGRGRAGTAVPFTAILATVPTTALATVSPSPTAASFAITLPLTLPLDPLRFLLRVLPVLLVCDACPVSVSVRPARLGVAGAARDAGHHSRCVQNFICCWPRLHPFLASRALSCWQSVRRLSPCPWARGGALLEESAVVDEACGAQAKAWPRCAVTMAMGQGARHLGSSLAPAIGKCLMGRALCASSLLAGAGSDDAGWRRGLPGRTIAAAGTLAQEGDVGPGAVGLGAVLIATRRALESPALRLPA